MSEFLMNQAQEVSYLKDTKYEQRMWDIYIGANRNSLPPQWGKLLEFAFHDEALIQLEGNPNLWSEEEWRIHKTNLDAFDFSVAIDVVNRSPLTAEDLVRQAKTFYNHFRFCFLEWEVDGGREYNIFVNPPFVQIW